MTDLPRSDFFDIVKRRAYGPGPAISGKSSLPVGGADMRGGASRRASRLSAHPQGLSNVPYLAAPVLDATSQAKLDLISKLFGIPELAPAAPQGYYRTNSGKLWSVSLPVRETPHAYISAEIRPASVKLRVLSPEARRRRLHDGLKQTRSLPLQVRSKLLPSRYNDIGAFVHDLTAGLSVADLCVKSTRGEITQFSDKSRTRLASFCADLQALGIKPGFMFTLTYPGAWQSVVPDGKESKRHLYAMRRRLTRYLKRQGFGSWSALWFTEFQARGAPHYHIIGWGPLLKYADIRRVRIWSLNAWADIVAHPDPVHRARGLKAGTKFEKMRADHFGYAMKYAAKMKQKEVPKNYRNVGRFWGVWNFKLSPPLVLSRAVSWRQLVELASNLHEGVSFHSQGFARRISKRLLGGVSSYNSTFKPDASLTVFGVGASKAVELALSP